VSHDAKMPTGTARQVRWDRGQIRWTKRDIALLPCVGEQYAVRFDQLQAPLSRQPLGPTKKAGRVTASAVCSCLERWQRAGVATSASLMAGEPGWVWLTRKGLRLIDQPSVRGGVAFGPPTREHSLLTDGADGGSSSHPRCLPCSFPQSFPPHQGERYREGS
jgi:hypothetical protein